MAMLLSPQMPKSTDPQASAKDSIDKYMRRITDPLDREKVFGILLSDEPVTQDFPKLKFRVDAVKQHKIVPYINIFCDNINDAQIGSTYDKYLDEYIKICDSTHISYHYYPFQMIGKFHHDRFYGSLETIRKKSLQSGIPFWNVIQSYAHLHYSEPTPENMALQVYSALAYGSRGIGYFAYYTSQKGNSRLAPIDRFGYRTKTWEIVRNLNLQIHALAPIYTKLKSINVFHTGNVPRNCRGIDSAQLVESVSGNSWFQGGVSMLVGEFVDNAGKPYAMLVNKNMHTSTYFDVRFKKKGQIMIVSQSYQDRIRFEGEQNWLSPGCGVLLTVE
jgi:hypothetical protein